MKKNNKNQKKAQANKSKNEFPFYEKNCFTVSTDAGSLISSSTDISTSLLKASRLTGLQAIFDEGRINKVVYRLKPRYTMSTIGQVALYIERDTSDSIATTTELAASNFEATVNHVSKTQVLTWLPQEPADREFQSLSSFTSLGFYGVVASDQIQNDSLTGQASKVIYDAVVESWWTVRGRP